VCARCAILDDIALSRQETFKHQLVSVTDLELCVASLHANKFIPPDIGIEDDMRLQLEHAGLLAIEDCECRVSDCMHIVTHTHTHTHTSVREPHTRTHILNSCAHLHVFMCAVRKRHRNTARASRQLRGLDGHAEDIQWPLQDMETVIKLRMLLPSGPRHGRPAHVLASEVGAKLAKSEKARRKVAMELENKCMIAILGKIAKTFEPTRTHRLRGDAIAAAKKLRLLHGKKINWCGAVSDVRECLSAPGLTTLLDFRGKCFN